MNYRCTSCRHVVESESNVGIIRCPKCGGEMLRLAQVFIPYLGKSSNRYIIRGGGHLYEREKKAAAHAALAASLQRVEPFTGCFVLAYSPRLGRGVRRWDVDNYAMSCKILTDALRRSGVIPEDDGRYYKGFTVKAPERAEETGFLIELQEVA